VGVPSIAAFQNALIYQEIVFRSIKYPSSWLNFGPYFLDEHQIMVLFQTIIHCMDDDGVIFNKPKPTGFWAGSVTYRLGIT
jgi:hypothetical protein